MRGGGAVGLYSASHRLRFYNKMRDDGRLQYLKDKKNMKLSADRQRGTTSAPLTLGGVRPLELMQGVCAWRQSDEILNQIHAWHLNWMCEHTGHVFREIYRQDAKAGYWLYGRFETLPDWATSRFLLAPETCHRVRINGPDEYTPDKHIQDKHIKFFITTLLAERRLSGDAESGQRCWTALGDNYFAGSRMVDPRSEPWDAKADFVAPRIGSVVPVDFASPYSQFINSMASCPFEPYTPAEASALWAGLEEAFMRVTSVSAAAALLFTRFVKVIVPRKNPLKPHYKGSSSTPSHIGRLLLRNGHLMDVSEMAESLVHESIHALLDAVETSEPFAEHANPADEPLVRSPWSGRELPRRIYLHACFVWYGLAKFWRAATQSDAFPQEAVSKRLSQALCGFRHSNLVDNLAPHLKAIPKKTLEAIESLRGELESSGDLNWEP
jgi:hypothetical protein